LTEKNILGCFVSTSIGDWNTSELDKLEFAKLGELFMEYIYSETGIKNKIATLINSHYGKDLELILFQFQVNPIPYLVENLKEIENYRKSEKSIGLNIIIDKNNFFNIPEDKKLLFLYDVMFAKLEKLKIKITKLDTNMDLLIKDFVNISTANTSS
jgi:hypothetical protein